MPVGALAVNLTSDSAGVGGKWEQHFEHFLSEVPLLHLPTLISHHYSLC